MKYQLLGTVILFCLFAHSVTATNPLTSADQPLQLNRSSSESTEGTSGQSSENESEKKSSSKSPFRFLANVKDKVVNGFKKVCEVFPKVSRVQAFFKQKTMSDKNRKKLEEIAKKNKDRGWPLDGDIANVVNAHYTNTYAELKKALESDCNFFECDIRLEGPLREYVPFIDGEARAVTAHDSFQTNGMLFDDWVRIVAQSGRGIKVDLKSNAALDSVLATLKKYKIDERRLILNINVSQPGNGPKAGEDKRIASIRKAFPNCRIKLSPGGDNTKDGKYTSETADRLIEYAKAAGKPIMYALRAECVTPETVKKLEPYGKVSIWNSTSTFDPKDVAKEVERFRSWGVSGMIDLMSTHKK
ncbi:MAG: DUF2181 domain-containing protein [Candidatus Riflebacteria bacterium]|nr:DUF2181 domain-containing protein [Candidatus Riflebacteria bacterium]